MFLACHREPKRERYTFQLLREESMNSYSRLRLDCPVLSSLWPPRACSLALVDGMQLVFACSGRGMLVHTRVSQLSLVPFYSKPDTKVCGLVFSVLASKGKRGACVIKCRSERVTE